MYRPLVVNVLAWCRGTIKYTQAHHESLHYVVDEGST